MTELLHMRLLGYPVFSLGDRPLTFRRRKTVALLVYLVLTGRPTTRDVLAALLADETSERHALQSLRVSAAELRKALDGHLILSRQVFAVNRAAPYWVDVQEFQRRLALDSMDGDRAIGHATDLYTGDLLEGFTLRGASGFHAWLASERRRLHDQALRAWHTQFDAANAAGEIATALAVAERLLAASPADESMHAKAMRLLATHGQREQALALYERCRTALAERLGVAPLPTTTALYEHIRNGSFARTRASVGSFAGWSPESSLSRLVERLAAPECRLLTLVSENLAAATALALQAVGVFLTVDPVSQPFPDGVYVTAPGAAPQRAGAPPPSLAQLIWCALAESDDDHASSASALIERLATSTMLLILDGITPSEEDIALVLAMLQHAPHVTLLVTARERLFVQEEWVLDIGEQRVARG